MLKSKNKLMKYTKIRQRGENKVDINHSKAVIEAILFSAGRTVEKKELLLALEINENDLDIVANEIKKFYNNIN